MARSTILGLSLGVILGASAGCNPGGGTGGDGPPPEEEKEAVVSACNYRTVYEANSAAPPVDDPSDLFRMTQACRAQLEALVTWQGFDESILEHEIVKDNYLRALHVLLFQPAFRPVDSTMSQIKDGGEPFPPNAETLIDVVPETNETDIQEIPEGYVNDKMYDHFTGNIKFVALGANSPVMACCGNGDTMWVHEESMLGLTNEYRHWGAYIIFHEMAHLYGKKHVTCFDIPGVDAPNDGGSQCDETTDGGYGNQGAYLYALAVGSQAFYKPSSAEKLMPARAIDTLSPLFASSGKREMPSAQHLFYQSCASLLYRVNPMRQLYVDNHTVLCSAESANELLRLGYIAPSDPVACPGLSGADQTCCFNQLNGICNEETLQGASGPACAAGVDPDCAAPVPLTASPEPDDLCIHEDELAPSPGIVQRGDRFVVSRERLRRELGQVDALLWQAQATPVTLPDGSPGYRLTRLDPGSTFVALGLRLGDVLTHIDDEPISAELAARRLERLADVRRLSLGLIRGTSSLVLTYAIENSAR
ncbi:hypothetical protein [Sorangium sp. So ce233]|uniref:hypothetical protein n=1 Tax=Sorangium sp. So ce233 TaxID=3133290 RepID=UPI003F5E48AB